MTSPGAPKGASDPPCSVNTSSAAVIIAAHNEAATIAHTLATLLADAVEGEFDVVVACNGCTDDTASIARSVPGVRVIELEEASKPAALRAGDATTSVFPRLYLDADVELGTETARALAGALHQGSALAAGVPGRIRLQASSRPARWFLDFRSRLPVFHEGFIGAGAYALSRDGHARVAPWPDVIADDQYVLRAFNPQERVTVPGHHTVVQAPPDLRTIVRRGVRVRRGNEQLTAGLAGRPLAAPPAGLRTALADAARSPRGLLGATTFLFTTLAIRVRARWSAGGGDWVLSRRRF